MVAISLYRGNLHRVPDVPRRWLMPTPKISLKHFRSLLNSRSKALSRFYSAAAAAATTSNPISNDNGTPSQPPPLPEKKFVELEEERDTKVGATVEVKDQVGLGAGGGDCPVKSSVVSDSLPAEKHDDGNLQISQVEKPLESVDPNPENTGKADELNDKEKRKREIEEKLHVLNERKHNLVQVLKQILNAEEELKRRNATQGMANRPSVPLQVDVTNDSMSMMRNVIPRTGLETNLGGDMEGGEADDVSNHNIHSRHIHRMSSTSPSPSSESPHRRPPYFQHNLVLCLH
uniref:Uncharacterized protein n=1 Tax=Rhizophora mucronata TaxID=61149 RepID=A0A2P2J8B0_RHIMU